MKVLKQLSVVTLASVALAILMDWSAHAFGVRSFAFALLANWLVMSWVAILGQVVPVSLNAGYYRIRPWEQGGRLYKRLGVRRFQKLVRRGPLSIFSPTLRFSGGRSALAMLEREMRKAEAGHLILFLLMFSLIGYALARGWPDAAGWLLLINILLNGYPAMLQRYNRIRLERALAHATGSQPQQRHAQQHKYQP